MPIRPGKPAIETVNIRLRLSEAGIDVSCHKRSDWLDTPSLQYLMLSPMLLIPMMDRLMQGWMCHLTCATGQATARFQPPWAECNFSTARWAPGRLEWPRLPMAQRAAPLVSASNDCVKL